MAHNDYVNPAGQWFPETVPEPGMTRRLDQQISEGLNGDDGGTYAPATPILIGGAGVSLLQSGKANSFVGGVITGKNAASGGAIVLGVSGGVSSYPTITPPRPRTFVVPITDFCLGGTTGAVDFQTATTNNQYDVSVPGQLRWIGPGGRLMVPITRQRLIQGTTLVSVALTWRVGLKPAATPDDMPKFRVLREDVAATYSTTLSEVFFYVPWVAGTRAIGDVDIPNAGGPNGFKYRVIQGGTTGFVEPNFAAHVTLNEEWQDGITAIHYRTENGPVSSSGHFVDSPRPNTNDPDSYYKNGTLQTTTLVANANTTIEPITYNYFVDIIDPTMTRNTMHAIVVTVSNIAELKPGI